MLDASSRMFAPRRGPTPFVSAELLGPTLFVSGDTTSLLVCSVPFLGYQIFKAQLMQATLLDTPTLITLAVRKPSEQTRRGLSSSNFRLS